MKVRSLVGPNAVALGQLPVGSVRRLPVSLHLFPPLYAVTLAIPSTRMSVVPFGVAVLLGRMVPFLIIAFGISALFQGGI